MRGTSRRGPADPGDAPGAAAAAPGGEAGIGPAAAAIITLVPALRHLASCFQFVCPSVRPSAAPPRPLLLPLLLLLLPSKPCGLASRPFWSCSVDALSGNRSAGGGCTALPGSPAAQAPPSRSRSQHRSRSPHRSQHRRVRTPSVSRGLDEAATARGSGARGTSPRRVSSKTGSCPPAAPPPLCTPANHARQVRHGEKGEKDEIGRGEGGAARRWVRKARGEAAQRWGAGREVLGMCQEEASAREGWRAVRRRRRGNEPRRAWFLSPCSAQAPAASPSSPTPAFAHRTPAPPC